MTHNRLNLIILLINFIAVYGTCKVLGVLGSIQNEDSTYEAYNSPNAASLFPSNNNNSIQYLLFTPESPKEVCYFEPDESNKCVFNPSYKTKILIHGFTVQLLPGNFFEQFKDTFLEYYKYNVIIVNWTKYNKKPYLAAVARSYPVGINVGKMVNFLVKKGVNSSDVHIIGHSLGAHVAGVAGKQVSDLGRVTGVGKGLNDAIGSIDFYPNGGKKQPACQMGEQFRNSDGEVKTITSEQDMGYCYHYSVLHYFMNSIHICNYLSLECDSYEMYSNKQCDENSNPTDRMGFFCEQIPGLPANSKFYLNTSADAPYCEKE